MMILLKDVTAHGTGGTAAKLNHALGGKTGTTSDFTDAWFLGFSPSVTCGVWVGYDNRQSLGEKETGAAAALPIWITFMKAAIVGKDGEQFPGDPPAAAPAKITANSASAEQSHAHESSGAQAATTHALPDRAASTPVLAGRAIAGARVRGHEPQLAELHIAPPRPAWNRSVQR
jgi:penicillin-binding protein 1A